MNAEGGSETVLPMRKMADGSVGAKAGFSVGRTREVGSPVGTKVGSPVGAVGAKVGEPVGAVGA